MALIIVSTEDSSTEDNSTEDNSTEDNIDGGELKRHEMLNSSVVLCFLQLWLL